MHLFEYYFVNHKEKLNDLIYKKKIIRRFLQLIKNLKSAVEAQEWLRCLSTYVGISEIILMKELNELLTAKEKNEENEEALLTDKSDRWSLLARRLLLLAFTDDNFWDILKDNKDLFPANFHAIIDNPKSATAAVLEMQTSLVFNSDKGVLKEEIDNILRQLKIEKFRQQLLDIKNKIRIADAREEADLMSQFHDLSVKINELKNN